MPATVVTVFGGTGYLGSAIVRALLARGHTVRIATRHPRRTQSPDRPDAVAAVRADVRDPASVEAALEGAQAVVNAVGLYVEKGTDTFESVHVRGPGNVARLASKCGVASLVHISGIGVSAASQSSYVRARADGESVVQYHFANASIVRPSVLFGPDDSFLSVIDGISRLSPIFPLFGSGETRMQPVYVDDVAKAVARMLERPAARARVSELGGPRVYTYREIIEAVLAYRRRRRLLLPVPFAVWRLQAKALSVLPNPPLTEDQVILMRDDNIVGEGVETFDDLDMPPRSLERLLPVCLHQGPAAHARR